MVEPNKKGVPNNNIMKKFCESWYLGLKNLESITDVFEYLKSYLIKSDPKTLEEIVQICSDATTTVIKTAKEKESLKFIGGNFKIELLENEKVKLSMEAFFKSFDGKWVKKENSSVLSPMNFQKESYEEIKREKVITYELVDPS